MMFLKVTVFILLVGACCAQFQAQGRQNAGNRAVTIDCSDQAAVAEAVRSNTNYRCGTQGVRGTFQTCPPGQIFNSEIGHCIKNPNASSSGK